MPSTGLLQDLFPGGRSDAALRVTEEGLERRPPAAFAALALYEREDLQRLLRDDI